MDILLKKLAFLEIIVFGQIKDVQKPILISKVVPNFQKNNVLKINYAFLMGLIVKIMIKQHNVKTSFKKTVYRIQFQVVIAISIKINVKN